MLIAAVESIDIDCHCCCSYIGRQTSASPATGSRLTHECEQNSILTEVFS